MFFMVKSAYIHIPFCKSKCHYCSFISFDKLELKKDYLKNLEQEINTYYNGEILNTLYFGGGTPSILEVDDFSKLIAHFNISKDTEITTELNPDGHYDKDKTSQGLTFDYLRRLFDIGINRISLGAQTFDDNLLKQINRRHDSKQIIQAVENAKKSGFKNISLDFIYGLPNQSAGMFFDDLQKAIKLGVQHISLYGLSIEEGCYFYNHRPQNLPDDDEQADMYIGAIELLTSNGFEHYEISNFSLPDYNSKHNLNYWNNEEYYGFGVAAHGYTNDIRYGNKETIEDYIQNPIEHKFEKFETQKDKLEEEIFLGLRKMNGIDIQKINNKFNIDFEDKYLDILKKYEGLNLLKKTEKGYSLTPNGVLVSNTILSEFLD